MSIFNGSEPVQFDDDLPKNVDVVVIGGGIAGISTAWFLIEQGLTVLVCEKGRIACEQSSRNWGWVRQQGRDAAELPIMIDAMNSWEKISSVVGNKVGFKREGTLYLAKNEDELAKYEQWLEIAKPYQLDSRMLTGNEVNEKVSNNTGRWIGALYTQSDGRAEPFTTVPAIADYLHERGLLIKENCAARSLDMEGGMVRGVVTEHGLVRANSVVVTGGAWTSRFLGNHDIKLPQLTVRSTVARTESSEDFFSGNAVDQKFAFRRREDGGYTIASNEYSEHFLSADSFRYMTKFAPLLLDNIASVRIRLGGDLLGRLFAKRHWSSDDVTPFEQTRVLNPEPSSQALKRMRVGMRNNLPILADISFAETWAGMIDLMPDVVPVMDRIESHPGLFVGTGFSGHGFGFGPGAGKILAGLIIGQEAEFDLSRFRYSRFFDGSRMIPGPGL